MFPPLFSKLNRCSSLGMTLPVYEGTIFEDSWPTLRVLVNMMNLNFGPNHFGIAYIALFLVAVIDNLALQSAEQSF